MKLFTVVIVKGGQHWWALAFSSNLPLYLYECICSVLFYSANKVSSSSFFFHAVCAYKKSPKFVDAEAPLPWDGDVANTL